MFYTLHATLQLLALISGLIIFCIVAWRRFDLALGLILFLAPTYLLRIYVGRLSLTALEILILIAFLIWLVKKISTKMLSAGIGAIKGSREFLLPLLLILAGAFVSTLLSSEIKVSAGIFKAWLLEPTVFVLLALDTIATINQIKKTLLFLVFSGAAQASTALGYWFAGQLTFDGRLTAFYLSPNHLAMALSPCFIVTLYFLFAERILARRILFFCVICLQAFVLYLTLSYGAWFGIFTALAALVFILWQEKIISRKKIVGIGCLFLIIFLIFAFLQFGSEKLNNLLNSDRSSWQSRLMVWRAAFRIVKDNWFLGIGPGMFQKYYLDYQKHFPPYLEWAVPQPQNIFLAFWLQTGLFGLVGFLWLVINFFRWIIKYFWRKKEPLALALMAVMIYILVHGLLDTPFWKNDLALIFLAIAALGYRAARLSDS